jgi:hypothetical protein
MISGFGCGLRLFLVNIKFCVTIIVPSEHKSLCDKLFIGYV